MGNPCGFGFGRRGTIAGVNPSEFFAGAQISYRKWIAFRVLGKRVTWREANWV